MQLSTARAHPRRRPSGEPPPLPRETGWERPLVLLGVVLGVGIVASVLVRLGVRAPWGGAGPLAADPAVPPGPRDLASRLVVLGSVWVVLGIRIGVVVVAAAFRRWRQIVVFLATMALTDWTVVEVLGVKRPVIVAGSSEQVMASFPSQPVATLTVTLVAMAFALAPAGRPRNVALWSAWLLGATFALARIVNGGDPPFDAAYAVALGGAAAVAAFDAFVPEAAFPVRYAHRRGPTAHLDLDGDRGRAIVAAVREQLGFTVTSVRPFGLEGSGGSSPALLEVEEPPGRLFGKVYTRTHLRADRWYRMGRTMLYGQLEDEVPFASVRRLVEYEDYALRLLDDAGVRVAHPYGIVELTPNGEYMLVTEFFEHAVPLHDAAVDDRVIDDGLELVRSFWDAGLAHRDIKPANLLVWQGHLQLVDVSGLEVRPTSWRQAIDLANMMLTLALRSDPDRVYAHAQAVFRPKDIAEAFAADRGMAVPTQLQAKLREDPRPIVARFTELAAPHDPIAIQRWSVRRSVLLAGAAIGSVVVAGMLVDALLAGLR